MLAAPSDTAMEEEQVAYASVPLHPDSVRQAALFADRDYPLPRVLPGEEAVIVDADDWTHNFKKGRVIAYDYTSGLHTIQFTGVSEGEFFGREIRKSR
jgi:hypothetical protein